MYPHAPGRDRRSGVLAEATMTVLIARFLKDQSGATSIEYAVIAASIAGAIISVVRGVGTGVLAKYASVSTALQ
jgi:pilus assembly protein Flp/PilA